MGTPEFAVTILRKLVENNYNIVGVITAPDKPAGRGRKLHESAVKEYAKSIGLHLLQPTNLKQDSFIEELKTYGCNVDVYDPWVDPAEEKHHYEHGIIEDPFKSDKKYDSIVVAVAHKQFIALSEDDYKNISSDAPVIMDIKGIVPNRCKFLVFIFNFI